MKKPKRAKIKKPKSKSIPLAGNKEKNEKSNIIYFDDDLKNRWRYAFEQARVDREKYFNWIKDEIESVIQLINKYDKIYVLGGLGSMLISTAPNLYNQFLETYNGPDRELVEKEKTTDDDEIEVLLEYAISLASASSNSSVGVIPSNKNIREIRNKLSRIKFNLSFYEMSAEIPTGGTEFDHWIKIRIMEDTLHVRGEGYHSHIAEVYKETFDPHDRILTQVYGFDSKDLFDTVIRLDLLVTSKIGNPFGGAQSHRRLTDWMEENGSDTIMEKMMKTGKHFIQQFTEENLDLYDERSPEGVSLLPLDYVEGYSRLFWVIPKTEKQKKIFECLSHKFGDNNDFVQGKFGGFPLGDTIIHTKPLIKVCERYYCFSINLAFRNLFKITANLLQLANSNYYEQSFKGNASYNSRDNYIERKTKQLFEKLLPTVKFYHSLKYNIIEDGISKEPELDIIGVGNDTVYIIEVKAGELNKKHRRGALRGLKQRLKETISEGSYQCYRAERYINENTTPAFTYAESGKKESLKIDKSIPKAIIKISVTFEHFSTVSVNLKYLIEAGVLSNDYKWAWIVSMYDLMIFSELISSEAEFKEYISCRLGLYEREDVQFLDEIDILGFYLDGNFPLPPKSDDSFISIVGYKDDIDRYYTRRDVGIPNVRKPKKVTK